jgi:anti-sigma factor RsiW
MNADPTSEFPERTIRDLAALADGSLTGRRRDALERKIADSPALAAALDRQRLAVAATRGIELSAPDSLRARLERQRARPSRAVRGRRLAFAGGLAATAAVAILTAVLVLPTGTGGPSLGEAAALTSLPATEPAPAIDPNAPPLLEASGDGVPFPNLRPQFGWVPSGSRTDEIDGREATTVYYERGDQRIGYTIVSGEALEVPEGGSKTTLNDVELTTIAVDGGGPGEVVTWLRDGHTCVMSGEGVSTEELRTLAAWKGDGAVPF